MRLILDTHTFLWFVEDSPRLSAAAKALIEDPEHEVFLSVASVWEMAIKTGLGRITFDQPYADFMRFHLTENNIQPLDVALDHAAKTASLPHTPEHRDPFDRLLAAQSLVENMPIVSYDAQFDHYGVRRLW